MPEGTATATKYATMGPTELRHVLDDAFARALPPKEKK